jgi:hypothetical protein
LLVYFLVVCKVRNIFNSHLRLFGEVLNLFCAVDMTEASMMFKLVNTV